MSRMVTPSPEPYPTVPPLLVRKTRVRRSFHELRSPAVLTFHELRSPAVLTARDRRFEKPPMSLPALLQGPSGGHARARKSGLKLAVTLSQPPSRHTKDSVRASNGLAASDTSELSRTPELSQTKQTRQSVLDAWLVSVSPLARAAQSSEDDPRAAHEPEPGPIAEDKPSAHGAQSLSPPRALTSTPPANLPRIPIRRYITGWQHCQWR